MLIRKARHHAAADRPMMLSTRPRQRHMPQKSGWTEPRRPAATAAVRRRRGARAGGSGGACRGITSWLCRQPPRHGWHLRGWGGGQGQRRQHQRHRRRGRWSRGIAAASRGQNQHGPRLEGEGREQADVWREANWRWRKRHGGGRNPTIPDRSFVGATTRRTNR
jgi:hypothetical protein